MLVRRKFIDVKTGQLHLRVAGQTSSNIAIICLHMMPKSGRIYAKILPELATDYFVIAPDFPGCGESDHFAEGHLPSVADYADSIEEVIRYFKLEQAYLVGYHTGSMVAVELAYRNPILVKKLVNLSAPILTRKEINDYHQYFAPIPLDQDGTRFRIMWERILHYAGPGFSLEMASESMAENMRGGERYEEGHVAAFNYAPLYVERLTVIEQPIWVINLADDLEEQTRRAAEYLNNGHVTEFPNWGFGCLDLWSAEMASEILTYLSD